MDSKEWDHYFDVMVDEEIDRYLEENKELLFRESPLKSKNAQKEESRQELLKVFRMDDLSNQTEQALILIRDMLPQMITKDEWEVVYEEFASSDEALLSHFEAVEAGEFDQETEISIAEMCGISTQTLSQCYLLAQKLYDQREYANARSLFGFLLVIAPFYPEFWISAGMSSYQMEDFQAAMEIYKLAQQVFPENVAFYIHSANTCIAEGDTIQAKVYLGQAKELINHHPEYKKEWGETWDFLNSRVTNFKKQ